MKETEKLRALVDHWLLAAKKLNFLSEELVRFNFFDFSQVFLLLLLLLFCFFACTFIPIYAEHCVGIAILCVRSSILLYWCGVSFCSRLVRECVFYNA